MTKSFESIISNRLLLLAFEPKVELEEHIIFFEQVTSMTYPEDDACKKISLTIAYNNLGIYYSILGQNNYIRAVEDFKKAIQIDPVSIQIHRNLAWLQHATTVDSNGVDNGYKTVWDLNWLRTVVHSMVHGVEISYEKLRKQILPHLQLGKFEESSVPNAISSINGTDLRVKKNILVLVIADRTWNMQFVHTGHGSVFLSIHSNDCIVLNPNDKTCQLFFEHLLKPRLHQLNLFEISIGKLSCNDPLLLKEAGEMASAELRRLKYTNNIFRYLNLLKFQLIGFYDDRLATNGQEEERQIPSLQQRLQWLNNKKRFSGQSLSISMGRLNNINSSIHLDQYPGDTMASLGMLNNMYFITKHIISQRIPGHFLEAGVWRGGMTIWIKAVLNAMIDLYDDHSDNNNSFKYKVFVADSFGGVPPPRDSNAFSFDQWHHLPKNLYKVQLQQVISNFEKYLLFSSTSDVNDENNILTGNEVEFIPGYFNDSLPTFNKSLSLLRIDADSYESIMDVLNELYDNVVPGGIIMIDDWHLNGARRAVLEFRLKRGILEPLFPVPEDAVNSCEERMPHLYHVFPNKPVQGMFFIKRPKNERGFDARQYYSPFTSELGIDLEY
eukprot:g9810.t1